MLYFNGTAVSSYTADGPPYDHESSQNFTIGFSYVHTRAWCCPVMTDQEEGELVFFAFVLLISVRLN